ncbi:hypothetical protein Zm00014a_036724 [Zea mays]|uniref:Uncharacterized protein n=1 Tax=Zea mays TaxID=4577 RepID=A0A3L6FCZ7_MAIZE|nr:hypothetical protein Zm00014a_036724 [Zea mays]
MEELGSRSYKAHKNNIKKPTRGCQTSTKGSYKAQKNGIKKPSATARPPPRGSRASLATFSGLSQSQVLRKLNA